MAINENSQLSCRHTLYSACSGGGKSQAVKRIINKRGVNVLGWDVEGEHWGIHTHTIKEFIRTTARAIKSGKTFRVFYQPSAENANQEHFQLFCKAVWTFADGNTPIECVIEEYADVSVSAGQCGTWDKALALRGRKYNIGLHVVTQRPQNVPKQMISQCVQKYIGMQNMKGDIALAADICRVTKAEIEDLEPLQFYYCKGKSVEKVKIPYKKYK